MEHMEPVRIAEIRHAEELVPGIDPSVAVEMMVLEAEALRVQADVARAGYGCPEQMDHMRDLSPLGR